MKKLILLPLSILLVNSEIQSQTNPSPKKMSTKVSTVNKSKSVPFDYVSEQFADLRILRYEIPSFDELTLKQKTLLYYLSEAALCGRDIIWDQNYKYNLMVRKTLEAVISDYKGDVNLPEYKKLLEYGITNYTFEEYEKDIYDAICYIPFFTSIWFGTIHQDELIDKNFPYFLISKLFYLIEII